ncbi:immunoglobulin lambda-1 light chain-like [Hypanus sabinus]|uniref:immunoglobulin lambda-1 light chain-like n=1 Tax=Hypanus sabinus TaxID=79690 RepID=UPI0028C3F92C|nr:immunoglobulin lambda-1 light chain-like [Hypanus sabinus]
MSGRVGVILIICAAYSNAEITLNQEGSLSVQPRGTVKIGCRVSGANLGNDDIGWYQQKPDGAPRFLLYHDLSRDVKGTGSPDRFSGSSQSSSNASCGKLTRPTITLLPPASKQITVGQRATLVCLVNNFSPRSAEGSWEMDGNAVKAGVLTTRTVQNSDLKSYLTLTASEWNSHEEYTCGVTHQSLGSPLKRSIQKSGCT